MEDLEKELPTSTTDIKFIVISVGVLAAVILSALFCGIYVVIIGKDVPIFITSTLSTTIGIFVGLFTPQVVGRK